MNSRLWEQKIEKIRMMGCGGGSKADENWMDAETLCVCDVASGQRDMADDQCARL